MNDQKQPAAAMMDYGMDMDGDSRDFIYEPPRKEPMDFCLNPVFPLADLTDEYFAKTSAIAVDEGDCEATYAVFLRTPIVVATFMACEYLRRNYPEVRITPTIPEGALAPAGKKILEISGEWSKLSMMETLFLQRIGWACVSARAAFEMCMALKNVSFIDMHARHAAGLDMQLACSYGASVGSRTAIMNGAKGFIGTSTAVAAPFFGQKRGVGTMPHALIGFYQARKIKQGLGDDYNSTVEATRAYVRKFSDERQIISLVDYNGLEISDSLAVARWFYDDAELHQQGKHLGFRLDTHGGRYAEGLDWDRSVEVLKKWTHLDSPDEIIDLAISGIPVRSFNGRDPIETARQYLFDTGVTAASIVSLRKALDDAGYKETSIIASSGFNVLKCQMMGNLSAPITAVGTGSFVPSKSSSTYATADIIAYDGVPSVKVGREYLLK